jgi:hypothetical protein
MVRRAFAVNVVTGIEFENAGMEIITIMERIAVILFILNILPERYFYFPYILQRNSYRIKSKAFFVYRFFSIGA